MSASTAIGMVSESLRNLLVGEMTLQPTVNVTVLSPDELGGDRRINLFLYKVQEHPFLRNLDWQVRAGAPNQLVPPPLSLSLSYLVTAYAQNDPQTGNATAHAILGEAMRIFYENPIVPSTYLVTGLQNTREQIKVIQNTLDLEELSTVWGTFTQPFRLSVLYEVSVVQIDMLPEREQVMAKRVLQVGVPDVRAPFRPPVVETMAPASGPPGTTVTFSGQQLSGWQASVRISDVTVLDGVELAGDTFTATIPATLGLGFHEVRLDVAHLFRRVFFFEVT
jgi:hypothetical protein